MCGIAGIVGTTPVNQSLYDALTVLQHRGQDAAGIVTISNGKFRQRKANGLVKDVFETKHMHRLQGSIGIAHVRYPTAGSSSAAEAQPFYVNSPYGIALAHNGNLTNAKELRERHLKVTRRHINTSSDSELLLNVLAYELEKTVDKPSLEAEDVFRAVSSVNSQIRGGYAVLALIIGGGIVAFRDPNGIRPLVYGSRVNEEGKTEYMVASESVALDILGFKLERDVRPGEALYITEDGRFYSQQCCENAKLCPCIFEYVYFARPDSYINDVSVYASRVNMGRRLGAKIQKELAGADIDVIIPIPETSCDIALEIAKYLGIQYRQGFVKNRYIGRTFIMPGQKQRKKSVRNKLNAIKSEFKDKNVLLVDDSIVRGTTSGQIIDLAREAGARKVYFASAAPEVRYPNVYGIDMATSRELIAYGKTNQEICDLIGADGLVYQGLDDLKAAVREENPALTEFEDSIFTGHYVTNDIDEKYLAYLDQLRNDDAKAAALYLGDSFEILASMKPESVDLVFADPPYFLSTGGVTCQGGKMVSVDKGDWDQFVSFEQKVEFNRKWINLCKRILKPSGTLWISGTLHNIYIIGSILEEEGFKIINNITWQKKNPPPNLACKCFTHSTETGEKVFGKHPTQKPLYLLERIIDAASQPGDLIVDPFTGSSTTGVAALSRGRMFVGIDNNQAFLEISKNRLIPFEERSVQTAV